MPLIPDYWSTHTLYDDPYLCTKVMNLFDSSGSEVTEYLYTEPSLTLSFSGTFTYHFSLEDYPDTTSKTFTLKVPSSCNFETPYLSNIVYLIGDITAETLQEMTEFICLGGGCLPTETVSYIIEVKPNASFMLIDLDARTIDWADAT